MTKNLLTEHFAEPLKDMRAARIVIDVGDGNLDVAPLLEEGQVLAKGALQYFEKQGVPSHCLALDDGQATFTVTAGRAGQPWFRLPWSGCNGATLWRILLNTAIPADIKAHSNGGNVRLDLSCMLLTRVSAETGGGNIDLVLPENARDLDVAAKTGGGSAAVAIGPGLRGSSVLNVGSGAGNVTVRIPSGVAARIHATTGLGKVVVDPRFDKIESALYQSPDFDGAADRIEIIAKSGAGNVTVNAG